jgi:hypothetical protein
MSYPVRKTLLGLVLAGSLIFAVSTGHAAPSGGCVVAATTTCTFNYTGAPEAWVVPAGVTSATFDVFGASSGDDILSLRGLGGEVKVTAAVSTGDTYQLLVGGGGGGYTSFGGGAAGFNGGGAGGAGGIGGTLSGVYGAGGGGGSDVRSGACAATLTCGLADRIIVAGGGGGGSISAGGSFNAKGGDGGYPSGSPGTAGGSSVDGGSGGGGTQFDGGALGLGAFGAASGTKGALGLGGGGGTGANEENQGGDGGGGGGGGYYGGGGGGGGEESGAGGGGGGGSSFGPAGATFTNGVQSGIDGLITVTYTTPSAVTLASASAHRTAKGVLLRWRTGTEVDLLGFQVYRSRGHSWRRITHSLIAANGSVSGALYRFLDKRARHGVSYRYRIKAVNRDGTASWFGPVRVM